MECGHLLLVVLVLVQCCVVLSYNGYYNENQRQSYVYRTRSPSEVLIMAAISACINVFLLGLIFLCMKYCCPTCCRTVRPGYVIGEPALMMQVPQQHPPGYSLYPNAPPPESIPLFEQPTHINQQHQQHSLIPPRAGFVQPPPP